ncbi:MAG: hypothetical protein C0453_11950 [Comamonadaceae bacterium]|nr:hypothetical protein [Comamonadaceae bacterium]
MLSADHIALIEGGVSVIVSSCGADLTPSVMRAVGSQISGNGCQLTVYLCRSQSGQLLQDVARSGRLAAVFSQPSTHRTVQLKTRTAHLREATEHDAPALQRYLAGMERELTNVGFAAVYARAMLACRLEDVVAIEFTPDLAFDQTPGPMAGQPISAPT